MASRLSDDWNRASTEAVREGKSVRGTLEKERGDGEARRWKLEGYRISISSELSDY